MGSYFSTLMERLWGAKEYRILILGLDKAGKTTILYKFQVGEVVRTVPTISFNVEELKYQNVKFVMWDLGGQTMIRPYWRCYYTNTDAILYVVDSADRARMKICREEFVAMLNEEELTGVPVIVFANKQDLKEAASMEEVSKELGLSSIKNREWQIFKTSALLGTGLNEGMDYLVTALTSK